MSRRVGVNLLWLDPGRVGGSEEYCVRLLDAFADVAPDHPDLDVHLFVNRRFATVYEHLVGRIATDVAPIDGTSRAERIVSEHRWLPGACRRRNIELVHHLGGTAPLRTIVPWLLLVHDLQPWALPENFSLARRLYLRALVPRAVRGAVGITTLSRWVQMDVHRQFGAPLDRMTQIPPGADSVAPRDDADVAEVVERYGLSGRPFFLYPAITYRHKNHVTLVRAFAPIVRRHPDARLVLSGGVADAEDRIREAVDEMGLTGEVIRTGRIPASDLDALYRAATALTFPSRYEGFGMPILEAMSRGCPVVASRACALPEVVGDGGALLDPSDVPSWSEQLAELIDDPGARARAVDAARTRALQFRWSDAAEKLADLYRTAPLEGVAST